MTTNNDTVAGQQQLLGLLVKECHGILDDDNNDSVNASDEMVKRLRALRNSFASSPALSSFLLEAGLLEVLERGMDVLRDGTIFFGNEIPVRRVIAQLMANATSASVEWCLGLSGPRVFPERYTYMALTEHTDISSALALSLYNISRKVDGFIQNLVGPEGCLVLSMMLQTEERCADEHGGENDALGLLLSYVCFEKEYLKDLFYSLMDTDNNAALNSNHVLLLQRLVHEVSLVSVTLGGHVVTHLHGLLMRSIVVNENDEKISRLVLQQCLHLLRDIAARQGDEPCDVMIDEGVLKNLLGMLEALTTTDASIPFQKTQPYKGYKSDVLSIIANASHRRTRVQEYIIQMNGVMMILHHLQADPDSPLSREWALYAVRNLCEGSAEARDAIQELQRVDGSSGGGVEGDYEVMYERERGRVKIGLRK